MLKKRDQFSFWESRFHSILLNSQISAAVFILSVSLIHAALVCVTAYAFLCVDAVGARSRGVCETDPETALLSLANLQP